MNWLCCCCSSASGYQTYEISEATEKEKLIRSEQPVKPQLLPNPIPPVKTSQQPNTKTTRPLNRYTNKPPETTSAQVVFKTATGFAVSKIASGGNSRHSETSSDSSSSDS